MNLGNLPYDSFREIALYLGTKPLLCLWSTQNHSIQKLLSSSGIIRKLVITDTWFDDNPLRRHFLTSLRDVTHVHVSRCELFYQREHRVPLRMSSLNPIILEIDDAAGNMPAVDGGNAAQVSAALDLRLRQALPRLETLTLRGLSVASLAKLLETSADAPPSSLEMPSNPTSERPSSLFALRTNRTLKDAEELFAFPKTLRTLICSLRPPTFFQHLAAIWKHFEALESITLLGFVPTEAGQDVMMPPKTLTSVHFRALSYLPFNNLSRLEAVFGDSLTEISLELSVATWWNSRLFGSSPPEVPAVLSPKITSMAVSFMWNASKGAPADVTLRDMFLTSFWKSLTHLTSLTVRTNGGTLLLSCSTPDSLDRFSSYSSWCPDNKFAPLILRDLPPNITHLTLEGYQNPLSKWIIADLPRTLRTLTVPSFNLYASDDFHKVLPNCQLHLPKPISFWNSGVSGPLTSMADFANFWSPSLDFRSWTIAVHSYFTARNIFFKLNYENPPPAHLSIRPSDATELALLSTASAPNTRNIFPDRLFDPALLQAFPNITKLVLDVHNKHSKPLVFASLPFSLTHIELNDTPLAAPLHLSSIKHLSSRATVNYDFLSDLPPSGLVHLDTPNWSFYGGSLVSWKLHDMEKLRMHIEDMADYNVVDFLTKVVNPKTRSNMVVSMTYCATTLIHNAELSRLKDVTMKSMQEATDKVIRKRLSEPVSMFGAASPIKGFSNTNLKFGTPVDASEIAVPKPETIGAVLSSLTLKPMSKALHPLINVPKSAKTVRLDCTDIGNIFALGSVVLESLTPTVGANRLLKRQFLRTEVPPPGPFQTFGNNLTHLELLGTTEIINWFRDLPSSLVYLRMAIERLKISLGRISQTDLRLPPQLQTLVLESIPVADSKDYFQIDFDCFPASLQHIALIGEDFDLRDNGLDHTGSFKHLVNLKTFYVSSIAFSAADSLSQLLPMDTIERFVCGTLLKVPNKVAVAPVPASEAAKPYHSSHFQGGDRGSVVSSTSLPQLLQTFPKLMVEDEKLIADQAVRDARVVRGTLDDILATGVTAPTEDSEVQSITSAFAATNFGNAVSTATAGSSSAFGNNTRSKPVRHRK